MSYTAGQVIGGNPTATFLNNELQKIEVAFREYLSRIETVGNQMEEALDMNGHAVLNALTDPTDPTSLVTYQQLKDSLGNGVDVSSLIDDLQDLQNDVTAVQIQFSSFGSMIDANNAAIQAKMADLTALQNSLATTQGQLTDTITSLTTLQGSVTALTQTVSSIQTIATTNQANVMAAQSDATAALANLAALQTNVNNNQTALAALTPQVATNQSDIGILNTQVATAQTNIAALQTLSLIHI